MRRRLGYGTLYAKRSPSDWRGGSNAQRSCVPATALQICCKRSKFPSANLAPKIELKWAINLENRGQGEGVPHRTLEPKMDQISILGALVALGLSSWRLGSVLGAFWDRLERLLGPNLGPNMEPTWSKIRSKN